MDPTFEFSPETSVGLVNVKFGDVTLLNLDFGHRDSSSSDRKNGSNTIGIPEQKAVADKPPSPPPFFLVKKKKFLAIAEMAGRYDIWRTGPAAK